MPNERKLRPLKVYPDWVCMDCGNAAGRGMPPGHIATFHNNVCGVCEQEKSVTQPRDFCNPTLYDFNRVRNAPKLIVAELVQD